MASAPHDKDAERAVLGAILVSDSTLPEVADLVEVDDFYIPSNKKLYSCMLDIYKASGDVNPITVHDALKFADASDGGGGPDWPKELVGLQTAAPVLSQASSYAKIVRNKAVLRRLLEASREIQERCLLSPSLIDDLVQDAESLVFEASARVQTSSLEEAGDVLASTFDNVADSWLSPGGVVGVPTGYKDIDYKLSGLRRGALVVLGARPGMGKSALALNIASHVAIDLNLPVLYFSIEMQNEEILSRLLTSISHVNFSSRDGRKLVLSSKDWIDLNEAAQKVAAAPLLFDDSSEPTVLDVMSRAKKVQAKYGQLGLIVVDYLQLMRSSGQRESRQLEVSEISRKLKTVAKDLNCPVLALSQLSRGLEGRQNKRPMLSDLRESGAIEQDADVVSFLYRDDYYNEDSEDKGFAELIISKHRQGSMGTLKLGWLPNQMRFATLARGE